MNRLRSLLREIHWFRWLTVTVLTVTVPGLVQLVAQPFSAGPAAYANAATSLLDGRGAPVTPEQLMGSAAGVPSLVDPAATTTAKAASPSDGAAKSGKRPAGALSVDAEDVVPDKKFTRSSPGKPGSGV